MANSEIQTFIERHCQYWAGSYIAIPVHPLLYFMTPVAFSCNSFCCQDQLTQNLAQKRHYQDGWTIFPRTIPYTTCVSYPPTCTILSTVQGIKRRRRQSPYQCRQCWLLLTMSARSLWKAFVNSCEFYILLAVIVNGSQHCEHRAACTSSSGLRTPVHVANQLFFVSSVNKYLI